MGVSGGVTASTSSCRKEGGVKGTGDSAVKVDIRTFQRRLERKLTYGGNMVESLWRGRRGRDRRRKAL